MARSLKAQQIADKLLDEAVSVDVRLVRRKDHSVDVSVMGPRKAVKIGKVVPRGNGAWKISHVSHDVGRAARCRLDGYFRDAKKAASCLALATAPHWKRELANQNAPDELQEAEEPTDAQKEAGNYQKEHRAWEGFDISIENAKGSRRNGTGPSGRKWSVKMPADYGYFRRTEGKDGDHVDCYIGNEPEAHYVYIVDQIDIDSQNFDEHKCLICFPDLETATETYKKGFSDRRGAARMGAVTTMTVPEFKEWLKGNSTKRAVAWKKDLKESAKDFIMQKGDDPNSGLNAEATRNIEAFLAEMGWKNVHIGPWSRKPGNREWLLGFDTALENWTSDMDDRDLVFRSETARAFKDARKAVRTFAEGPWKFKAYAPAQDEDFLIYFSKAPEPVAESDAKGFLMNVKTPWAAVTPDKIQGVKDALNARNWKGVYLTPYDERDPETDWMLVFDSKLPDSIYNDDEENTSAVKAEQERGYRDAHAVIRSVFPESGNLRTYYGRDSDFLTYFSPLPKANKPLKESAAKDFLLSLPNTDDTVYNAEGVPVRKSGNLRGIRLHINRFEVERLNIYPVGRGAAVMEVDFKNGDHYRGKWASFKVLKDALSRWRGLYGTVLHIDGVPKGRLGYDDVLNESSAKEWMLSQDMSFTSEEKKEAAKVFRHNMSNIAVGVDKVVAIDHYGDVVLEFVLTKATPSQKLIGNVYKRDPRERHPSEYIWNIEYESKPGESVETFAWRMMDGAYGEVDGE